MAKIKQTIERESKELSAYEPRRRFMGLTKAQLASEIGVTVRTYTSWVTTGTTRKNADRIKGALVKLAEAK